MGKMSCLKSRFPGTSESQLNEMLVQYDGHAGLVATKLNSASYSDVGQEPSNMSTTAHVMMRDGTVQAYSFPFGLANAVQSLKDAIKCDVGGQLLVIEEDGADSSASLIVQLPDDGGKAATARLADTDATSALR